MNIIIINHYAGSPKLGMEYRPYYLAKEWIKSGHRVIIIGASHSHVRTVQPKKVDKKTGSEVEFLKPVKNIVHAYEKLGQIEYLWVKTNTYQGNGLGRLLNIFSFTARLFTKAKNLAKIFKPDVVIASSTYPMDIYAAHKMAKAAQAKLVFEVHDLWPQSPIELGGYSPKNPVIQMIQHAEDYAYKHAEKVISILPNTLEHMKEHGLNPEKFHHIPNGVSLEEWTSDELVPKETQCKIDKIKEKHSILIAYVGSIGIANALESFIHVGTIINESRIALLIVGKGPEKSKLEELVSKSKIDNVFFIESIPKKTIPNLLSMMNFLYIGLQNQPLFRFGISPNKLFDYMMAKKPIIQAISAGNDLVTDANCGLTIEPENPTEIKKAIEKLLKMEQAELTQMGENGYNYIVKNHEYKILSQQFLDVIK
jgi:glycosyltransferase involved in cell wall biosynthesis